MFSSLSSFSSYVSFENGSLDQIPFFDQNDEFTT
jgi:hypothetical protein